MHLRDILLDHFHGKIQVLHSFAKAGRVEIASAADIASDVGSAFGIEKTAEGYLETNEKLMTSVPGLFAAGDIRDTDMWQVLTACADGARAAKYAAEYLEKIQ